MTETLQEIELPVQGMTCDRCVAAVQNALEHVEGVRSAKVVLHPGSASVVFDSTATDRSRLAQAIGAAGYSVSGAIIAPAVVSIGTLIPSKSSSTAPLEDWNLSVGGMHCASCVARVEDALRSVPGVRSARVNLATERASVTLDPSMLSEASLSNAALAAGYSVKRSELAAGTGAETLRKERAEGLAFWKVRLFEGLLLTAPLVVLGYAPIHWTTPVGWIMFPLATTLLLELGLPYFRGAWKLLLHGATNMDTLISIGAITAYGYSLVHLLRDSPPRASFLPGLIASAAYGGVVAALARIPFFRRVDAS